MATKKREVGTEVEAYCTKCKLDRLHVISTLKSDGNINKVMCRTCDGTHLFRLPEGDGKKTPAKRRKRGAMPYSETAISMLANNTPGRKLQASGSTENV